MKEYGGLGIPNLRDLNVCLLASWIRRYNIDGNKLWKQMIDEKYNTESPNIFYSGTSGTSSFFKGMIWAAIATKMGYKWKIENDKKVKFQEDNWLGPSSLAIQFWEIYVLVDEKSQTIFVLQDGTNLKCNFRRGVDSWLNNLWLEALLETASLPRA